jgi:GNAT superfamily N-acetyltransferase
MNIRELHLDDLDGLLVLYEHLHDSDLPRPERPVVESVFRNLLENPDHHYYGCFVDGKLISSCILSVIPNLTRGCAPYGLIENVVTHRDFRRRGYGRAILRQALADAWAAGCYKVMLLTGRLDEGTFSFYESAGFDRHSKQAFIAKPAG